jgi:hypothetical protein
VFSQLTKLEVMTPDEYKLQTKVFLELSKSKIESLHNDEQQDVSKLQTSFVVKWSNTEFTKPMSSVKTLNIEKMLSKQYNTKK